jgi:hypothetical protein
MKRNFDYVAMSDYQADMKETADHAAAAIEYVSQKAKNAERLAIEAIIAAGGRVVIPADRLQDPRATFEMTTWRNVADDTFVFEVKRS